MPIGQSKAIWQCKFNIQVIQVIQVLESFQVIDSIQMSKVIVSSGAIWWPNLELMQVAPSGGQICILCKWRNLVAKFVTDASGAT